jgi:hypothetical protein
MIRVFLLLVLIGVNLACKKDSLSGDSAFLVGKWQWVIQIINTVGAKEIILMRI